MRRPRSFIGPSGMGGMVGLWGRSSLIKSIQTGTITQANAQNATATISAVSTSDSVLMFQGYSSTGQYGNIPGGWEQRVELTNSTTVTTTEGYGSGQGHTQVLAYSVIEFMPGVLKSSQSLVNVRTAAGSNTTITLVDTARSLLFLLGCSSTNATDIFFNTGSLARLVFTSGTNVNLTSYNAPTSYNASTSFMVIEFF